MPSSKSSPPPASESKYPVIEGLVEHATSDEVAHLFDSLKSELATVKGPRAEHAKKASKAVERAEELLNHLIEVRERIEAEQKTGKCSK